MPSYKATTDEITMTHKIKLTTLPHAGSPGKLTADVAAANGIDSAAALAELKSRDGLDVLRVGNTRATAWTRA